MGVVLAAFPGAITVGGLASFELLAPFCGLLACRFFALVYRIWPSGLTSCIPCEKSSAERLSISGLFAVSLAELAVLHQSACWQLCSRAPAFGAGGPGTRAHLLPSRAGLGRLACGASGLLLHVHLASGLQVALVW